jgi:predicted dehydrogenase
MTEVTFGYEQDSRLRIAFLGTSGHAFRNFLPSLPYAAVDLVALWDPAADRAQAFARQFGAERWFTDLDRLLAETAPDAVLIGVESYLDGEPLNASLMARCLEAGCHVWTDKPVAITTATVRDLIALRDRADRVAAVGMKTMYNPAHRKARQILDGPDFGRPTSFTARYPLHIPDRPGLPLTDPAVRSCLGHIWHPMGTALATVGSIRTITHVPAPASGGGVAQLTFADGTVGSFHFSSGQSGTSPLERVEIVGEGSNLIIENASRLTWYRRGSAGTYGRSPSYFTDEDSGPLVWEPEMSLGQLYNNNNFVQGYAPNIMAFVDAARGMQPLTSGTLEHALEVLEVFESIVSS